MTGLSAGSVAKSPPANVGDVRKLNLDNQRNSLCISYWQGY